MHRFSAGADRWTDRQIAALVNAHPPTVGRGHNNTAIYNAVIASHLQVCPEKKTATVNKHFKTEISTRQSMQCIAVLSYLWSFGAHLMQIKSKVQIHLFQVRKCQTMQELITMLHINTAHSVIFS